MNNHDVPKLTSEEAHAYACRVVAAEVKKLSKGDPVLMSDPKVWATAQANVKTLTARVLAVLSIQGFSAFHAYHQAHKEK